MKKKSQQGVALIWIIIAGALLITGVGVVSSRKQTQKITPSPTPFLAPPPVPKQQKSPQQLDQLIDQLKRYKPQSRDQHLLQVLPPKERAELESAIRETQQVLKNIEVFNYAPPSASDIAKGLDKINKQAQEQIQQNIQKQQQQFQPPDIDKMMEKLRQNPPAVPGVTSPNEQQLEEFEKETGIDLDAPYGDCPSCK